MPSFPSPGRGAWSLIGGLLPAKPGATSRIGYYRAASAGEAPVGSTWVQKKDTSHHAHVVWFGVRAIQQLVGAEVDGWFGPQTQVLVTLAQAKAGIEADGIVGPATMKALLTPVITEIAKESGVPAQILGGLLTNESMLDPAAVGVNGVDTGLAQINLRAHAFDVTLDNALDPRYALSWTADDLARIARVWKGRTSVDVWDIAIANHNSPFLAKRWALQGKPPIVEGREFQIQEYVERAKAAWTG